MVASTSLDRGHGFADPSYGDAFTLLAFSPSNAPWTLLSAGGCANLQVST